MEDEVPKDEGQIIKDNYESQSKDLEWAVNLNRMSLRFLGIWPEEKHDKMNRIKDYFTIPLMIFCIIVFVFIPQMWALKLNINLLLLALDNVVSSVPAFVCSLKLFFLWQNSEVLKPVVNTITEDWLCPKIEWKHEIMRKEAGVARFLTICGYAFVGSAYVGWSLGPVVGLNVRVLSNITDYGKRNLLCQAYYPYDYSKSPNFELTHMTQVVGCCFLVMALAIPDTYLGILVYHLSAQFKILGISIEHFVQDDEYLQCGKSNDLNKKLSAYIERHVHLMRMVSAVEKSFNLLALTQLFCMYVMVCCLAFRIVYSIKKTDEKIQIFQILNLGAALMSVALFTLTECSASEALDSHSGALFYHIYNCKWYTISKQNIHYLMFMMVVSKNPQILTAGKIMPLSLSSYCTILKSIAGYLSVLITISTL